MENTINLHTYKEAFNNAILVTNINIKKFPYHNLPENFTIKIVL